MADEKDLKQILANIEKTMGLTIAKVKDLEKMDVEVISSGSFMLNNALGVGGYPKGRIIEIFGKPSGGKTLLSLLAIAEAQKQGDNAAFIDVEHAFDPVWAAKLGVDVNNLYFTQPNYGEQALEAVKLLVESGKFGIIVVDSVASLIPKAELEAAFEDAQIAQLARMMSRALKILTEVVGKSKCCLIFINQVRTNPMQMFGDCFEATSKVITDQGRISISKIVNQNLKVKVLSYDMQKKIWEFVPILGRIKKPAKVPFLQITADYPHDSGTCGFRCTPSHKIWTGAQWKLAKNFKIGDPIYVQVKKMVSSYINEVLIGSLLGDGCLQKQPKYTGKFVEEHSVKQTEYLNWKKELFGEAVGYQFNSNPSKIHPSVGFATSGFVELGKLRDEWYSTGRKRVPKTLKLTPLSLAIWFMDDGHLEKRSEGSYTGYQFVLSTLAFSKKENLFLLHLLDQQLGLRGRLRKFPAGMGYQLAFSNVETRKMAELICSFIIPSMQYKLPPIFQDRYSFKSEGVRLGKEGAAVYVREIKTKPVSVKYPFTYQYDLETRNHNYVVSNVLVHNSETTPGGEALKFYSSVRLRVVKDNSKTSEIKEGDLVVGHHLKINVRKNKVAPPFKEASFGIRYAGTFVGVDKLEEITEMALSMGVVVQKGPMYNFSPAGSVEPIKWQGRENFMKALAEDAVLRAEIESLIVRNN